MKIVTFSGKFSDIELLLEAKQSLEPNGSLMVELPSPPSNEYQPSIERNAYESFMFAVDLLKKESRREKKFSIEIRDV